MKAALLFALIAASIWPGSYSQGRHVHGPNCSGGWPTNIAFVLMKNAGLVDNASIDFSKTKTVRIASERVGKDLWHQVYLVTFQKNSGTRIQAIVVEDDSRDECAVSGPMDVFVVSKHLTDSVRFK